MSIQIIDNPTLDRVSAYLDINYINNFYYADVCLTFSDVTHMYMNEIKPGYDFSESPFLITMGSAD